MTQNIEEYDEEDLNDLAEDLIVLRGKLVSKKNFWEDAKINSVVLKAMEIADKDKTDLKALGAEVLEEKVKILKKFFTRVKNARKARKMKKKKVQEKAKGGGLTTSEKARMTRMKTNIPAFCQIIGIPDVWSESDDFEALKVAHADLNKRSQRTGHLRTLKAKWATVFTDSESVFPPESDFPKTGKEIEAFYLDLKEQFTVKKAENSEDLKWKRTYKKRVQKFFAKAPGEDAKAAVQAFHKDMRGAPVLHSDFKLWDIERSGKTFGLSRREDLSHLRLDTVSIKRENLKKLLQKYNGSDVNKLQDLGVVRTLYGKIVKFDDDFLPVFPAPKKKGKKRKKSEEDEEEEDAIEVRFYMGFYLVFMLCQITFSNLFRILKMVIFLHDHH